MGNYFIEYTNGECEWFEARTDSSAWNKAQKLERKQHTSISYMAETFKESEIDRVIYRK